MAPLTSTMSMPLSATTSAPLAASSSSSGTPPLSTLTGLTTSSTALTSGASVASGAGSSASLGASGASMLGSAGSLMRTVTPAMGMFGNLQAVGSALGSGSGALASPGLGGAAVTAGLAGPPRSVCCPCPRVGRRPRRRSTRLPRRCRPPAPAPPPGRRRHQPGKHAWCPLAPLAGRSAPTPVASTPRFDVRPTVVQRPVYAG
ncbi:hypothetical protein I553_6554 [Mycobacterium xenopi 4042]|uniref:Uncharacterized protein n=1 Tax=Mycobacterium xenopi 4042 TaxID=1299334 RepID=X8BFP3_MYCXE|nr:hypothetical protein I553_6554 [Mycobacterium xenopi 4042]